MLRAVVLFLLVANLAFFAWAQGLLRPWGLAPAAVSEPQRLQQQLQPKAMQVLEVREAARSEDPASAASAATSATPASAVVPAASAPASATR